MVYFKIIYQDETRIGPIMGNGGMLMSTITADTSDNRDVAMKRIELSRRRAAKGKKLFEFEPKIGCVALYPNYPAKSDGGFVIIPLNEAIIKIDSIR